MTVLLGLALALQGATLEVTATAEPSRAVVGQEVLYTLRATGRSTAAFRADTPTLDGLALLERRERTDVVYGARVPTRAYTLELRLRAEQIGTWTIGPVRVEQGTVAGYAAAVAVSVSSGGGSGTPPGVLALVQRVPGPSGAGPSVTTVVSRRSVFAGDQLDILTAAWLPRGLRVRLRQPPSLTPPTLAGVWAAPAPGVSGAVASRIVDGEVYDLFVAFQTVFPLNAGVLEIPPARLTWAEPRRRAGEERRLQVSSERQSITVRPLPTLGRPPAFDGPVARDLRIEYRLGRSSARAGAVLPVEVVISGDGNLALWAEPRVVWPAGSRAYQERVEERQRSGTIRRSGTKAFRYAVVPDSAGTLALPEVEYQYFDPDLEQYRSVRVEALAVPVVEGEVIGDRRTAPLLSVPNPPTPAERVRWLPPAVRIALVGAPLALLVVAGVLRRRRIVRRERPLRAEERLAALVHSVRPVAGALDPPALVAALRRRGVDRATAHEVVSLHREVEAERYGPAGAGTVTSALAGKLDGALSRLPARVWIRGLNPLFLLAVLAAGPVEAQSARDLYREGRYAAAADSFRKVAARTDRAGQWYDVAAAECMARRDAHAAAALLAAYGRAPRAAHVQRLWTQLARAHEPLRGVRPVWPFTPGEALLAAIIALWLGTPLLAFGRGAIRTTGWLGLGLAAAAGLAGAALH
ncbi:MAG: hypothetical protein ACRENB_15490, partial [Gemmatimonadales bacterium]